MCVLETGTSVLHTCTYQPDLLFQPFYLCFFVMKCLIILYSDESKASAKKKKVAFSCSRFLPGKHVVILVFPVKRINQNQVIILIINYPKTVTIT